MRCRQLDELVDRCPLRKVRPLKTRTARFNALLGQYVKVSKDEAAGRAGAGALLGALIAGPFGAMIGGVGGIASIEKLSHPASFTSSISFSARRASKVRIPVEQFDADQVFVNPELVAHVVKVGRTTVATWLANAPDSQRRIALAATSARAARTQ